MDIRADFPAWLAGGLAQLFAILFFSSTESLAANDSALNVPQVDRSPTLDWLAGAQASDDLARVLMRVNGFRQRVPRDGESVSEPTEAYLGHDKSHLYFFFRVVYSDRRGMRAHLTRREDNEADDWVSITLDTFNDQRRAYMFASNAYGIQWDALWTEGKGSDKSIDFLYDTHARLTTWGFEVLFSIPFSSLRFPGGGEQTWRVMLGRGIQASDEAAFWPGYSARVEGRLNQAALIRLAGIEGNRGFTVIPSVASRSGRTLASRVWVPFDTDLDIGVDAKAVLRDRVVIDTTVNPDFSQVESDEPQVAVNQRFELFFPEKRPFFLENANYFQTPIDLVFTRRIAAPRGGLRLTTKANVWAIGAMLIENNGPGFPSEEPKAMFGIFRASRDLFAQGSLGMILTDWRRSGNLNRVAGADGRLKVGRNWAVAWQAVGSRTILGETIRAGSAWQADVNRAGRQFNLQLSALGRSPGFATMVGYVPRVDLVQLRPEVNYRFRPDGRMLLAWGPTGAIDASWDYAGTRLEWWRKYGLVGEFRRQTAISVSVMQSEPGLGPQDSSVLSGIQRFDTSELGISLSTAPTGWLSFGANTTHGTTVNFVPPAGQPPRVAGREALDITSLLRPGRRVSIQTRYLFTRLSEHETGRTVLANHVLRSSVHLQFTRDLSLRTIIRYDGTAADPELTAVRPIRNLNVDILGAWTLNPWTAIYVGYNGNGRDDESGVSDLGHSTSLLHNADHVFVKASYLWRF